MRVFRRDGRRSVLIFAVLFLDGGFGNLSSSSSSRAQALPGGGLSDLLGVESVLSSSEKDVLEGERGGEGREGGGATGYLVVRFGLGR
jgi:hypothetical protein